ncbi:hypothetical protein F4775DRAFT_588160 [Biscogniauxia sp. FL1348]|nr:hypothetical protein F4775DRAFT_588160 [Biscogniauxia sp. FL1348]
MGLNFTNVTTGATHMLVTPGTPSIDQFDPFNPRRFERRISNYGYDVQMDEVHIAPRQSYYENMSRFAHGAGEIHEDRFINSFILLIQAGAEPSFVAARSRPNLMLEYAASALNAW